MHRPKEPKRIHVAFIFSRVYSKGDSPSVFYSEKNGRGSVLSGAKEIKSAMKQTELNHNQKIITKVMREAWFVGHNVKKIAGYFKIDTSNVYKRLSIRGLKVKKMQKELEGNADNS